MSPRDGAVEGRARVIPRISRSGAGALLVIAGAVLTFVSAFLPWLYVGGSSVAGYRLANFLFARWGWEEPLAWAGLLWYAVPLAGVIAWLLLWAGGGVHVRRSHAWLGLLAVGIASMFVLGLRAGGSHVGPGGPVAVGGGIALLAGWGSALAGRFGRPYTRSGTA